MSKITFEETNGFVTIEAKGHATGSPEVCSGLSAIMQGAWWYLAKHEDEFAVQESDGYLKIGFPLTNTTKVLKELVYESVLGIANGYPEYISVECITK